MRTPQRPRHTPPTRRCAECGTHRAFLLEMEGSDLRCTPPRDRRACSARRCRTQCPWPRRPAPHRSRPNPRSGARSGESSSVMLSLPASATSMRRRTAETPGTLASRWWLPGSTVRATPKSSGGTRFPSSVTTSDAESEPGPLTRTRMRGIRLRKTSTSSPAATTAARKASGASAGSAARRVLS